MSLSLRLLSLSLSLSQAHLILLRDFEQHPMSVICMSRCSIPTVTHKTKDCLLAYACLHDLLWMVHAMLDEYQISVNRKIQGVPILGHAAMVNKPMFSLHVLSQRAL